MKKFFITGPARSGTTIMSRCIDDHPQCICLFEGYIQKAAFGSPITRGHSGRMRQHGFSREQTDRLRNKVCDAKTFIHWYDECAQILKPLYDKQEATHIGDVIHTCPKTKLAIKSFPKIFTIRDPRAILYSGRHHTPRNNYLPQYFQCIRENLPYINDNTLVIKFEDFIEYPEKIMNEVYAFLDVPYNDNFMNRTKKPYDERFKFNPNATQGFDTSIINKWKREKKTMIVSDDMKNIIKQFGYEE